MSTGSKKMLRKLEVHFCPFLDPLVGSSLTHLLTPSTFTVTTKYEFVVLEL